MVTFFSISTGVEGYYIYPIPLVIVFSTPANSDTYEIRALFYEEVRYSTVNALVEAYNNGNIRDHTPNLHKQSLDRLVEITLMQVWLLQAVIIRCIKLTHSESMVSTFLMGVAC